MEMNKIQQIRSALSEAAKLFPKAEFFTNACRVHKLVEQALTALSDLEKEQAWQGIETCKPFDGLVAYIAFADGFWGLAKYARGEGYDFWSLSDFHDYETYKWYGNKEKPIMWYAIPTPIPAPPEGE